MKYRAFIHPSNVRWKVLDIGFQCLYFLVKCLYLFSCLHLSVLLCCKWSRCDASRFQTCLTIMGYRCVRCGTSDIDGWLKAFWPFGGGSSIRSTCWWKATSIHVKTGPQLMLLSARAENWERYAASILVTHWWHTGERRRESVSGNMVHMSSDCPPPVESLRVRL